MKKIWLMLQAIWKTTLVQFIFWSGTLYGMGYFTLFGIQQFGYFQNIEAWPVPEIVIILILGVIGIIAYNIASAIFTLFLKQAKENYNNLLHPKPKQDEKQQLKPE